MRIYEISYHFELNVKLFLCLTFHVKHYALTLYIRKLMYSSVDLGFFFLKERSYFCIRDTIINTPLSLFLTTMSLRIVSHDFAVTSLSETLNHIYDHITLHCFTWLRSDFFIWNIESYTCIWPYHSTLSHITSQCLLYLKHWIIYDTCILKP